MSENAFDASMGTDTQKISVVSSRDKKMIHKKAQEGVDLTPSLGIGGLTVILYPIRHIDAC